MYFNVLNTVFHKYFIRHAMSILQDILQGRVCCKVYFGDILECIRSGILIFNCVFNYVYIRYIKGRKALKWRGRCRGRGKV